MRSLFLRSEPGSCLFPVRVGNRKADSYLRIIHTERADLLFLVPGVGKTLRVNGRAVLIGGSEWLEPLAAKGKTPQRAVAVPAEECVLSCAKALMRSRLRDSQERPELSSLPFAATMVADQVRMIEFDATLWRSFA